MFHNEDPLNLIIKLHTAKISECFIKFQNYVQLVKNNNQVINLFFFFVCYCNCIVLQYSRIQYNTIFVYNFHEGLRRKKNNKNLILYLQNSVKTSIYFEALAT